jgi:hypothetical protein
MGNCVKCGKDIGSRTIITQTNIGPLCQACFDYYCYDRVSFLYDLKKMGRVKVS